MIGAYAKTQLLNWLLTGSAVTRPTTWYLSIHTGDPGDTGDNELDTGTDPDYVRKAVTFADELDGNSVSSLAASWTANGSATPYNAVYIGLWDAASGGNFLYGGILGITENVAPGGTFAIGSGRAVVTLI